MTLLSICDRLFNLPTPTVTEASPIIPSPGTSKNTESPWCESYSEINALDYSVSPIVSGKKFGDPVCENKRKIRKMIMLVGCLIYLWMN